MRNMHGPEPQPSFEQVTRNLGMRLDVTNIGELIDILDGQTSD
jgi:hypothetical protein